MSVSCDLADTPSLAISVLRQIRRHFVGHSARGDRGNIVPRNVVIRYVTPPETCAPIIAHSSCNAAPLGRCRELAFRELAGLGTKVDKFICDELRERDDSEDTLLLLARE